MTQIQAQRGPNANNIREAIATLRSENAKQCVGAGVCSCCEDASSPEPADSSTTSPLPLRRARADDVAAEVAAAADTALP